MTRKVIIKGWFGWGAVGKAGAFRTDAPYKPNCFEAELHLLPPKMEKKSRKKKVARRGT